MNYQLIDKFSLLDNTANIDFNYCEEVAVIGGGRWGKIISSILINTQPDIPKINLISQRNYKNVLDWHRDKLLDRESNKIVVWQNFDQVISNSKLMTAFVANTPEEHYETTKKMLLNDKHTFVEKPFVLNIEQAKELIDIAKKRNLVLAVGLEYIYATYIHYFRQILEQNILPSKIDYIDIFWQDISKEERWGALKQPDLTVNVATDIYPHILSFLFVLFNRQEIHLKEVELFDGGASGKITLFYGSLSINLFLSRVADVAFRGIKVFAKNSQLDINFTQEPGIITLNGESISQDPLWNILSKPLQAEISHFLRKTQNQSICLPNQAENFLYIVQATQEVNIRINQIQTELIHQYLLNDFPANPPIDVVVALREHLVLPLLKSNIIHSPKDEEVINQWANITLSLIHKLSSQPFATQKEILAETGTSKAQLIKLNAVLQEIDFVQDLICKYGHSSKYWQNTIIPLIQSGVVEAAKHNIYHYPFRIGIYPGACCMFRCVFCGRNYAAQYEKQSIPVGNNEFTTMFQEAPKDDPYRFYISGGLEPLTNPGIGEIIRCGAKQGFKLSMYTNGFMLTPDLLEKQDGLWDLDTLRISFYGVDPETTYQVTRNKNSFTRVLKNAKEFLKLRNARHSKMKFGFNFVILPGKAQQVLQLAEILAEINCDAGNERQIDFLTLREDYSRSENEAISSKEREELIEVFTQLAKRRKQEDLCNLYIDFGYALNAMNQGRVGKPLEMVSYSAMRKKGYPQISVVVDLLGDVYLYREAGFLERPGAKRYIIGRISKSNSLETVIRDFITSNREIEPMPQDTDFFDIFDHTVTQLLNQVDDDNALGIPFNKGPIRSRIYAINAPRDHNSVAVAHPTLAHPTLVEYTQKNN